MGVGIFRRLLQWVALPQSICLTLSFSMGSLMPAGESSLPFKMLVVPLVFVSLVCGAASLGDTGSVGG